MTPLVCNAAVVSIRSTERMTDRQTGRHHSICDEHQHQTGNQCYVDSKNPVRDSIWHLKGVKKLLGGKRLQIIAIVYSVKKKNKAFDIFSDLLPDLSI